MSEGEERGPLDREEWSANSTLLAGLAFGAATGLLEVAPLALARQLGSQVQMSRHFVWMTPVADLALFLAVALAMVALGLVWRGARARSLLLGTFAGTSALCLLLLVEPIHDLASLVLAVGIGVQVARRAKGTWTRRLLRMVPLAAPLLLVAIGGLAWWSFARDAAREREQVASAAPARAEAPNVLFLILDTVRASSLGLYGESAWTSPELEALAPRGVFFERAIAPSPWTLPSHASMFTGRWPHRLGVDWNPLGPAEPTLAETLTSEGYATAGFVGNMLYASRTSGLARGFGRYEDYPVSAGQIVLSSSLGRAFAYSDGFRRLIRHHELLNRKSATEVNREFLAWLDAREEDGAERPWFAFLNYYDAHEPYFPPDSILNGREWNDYNHRGGVMLGGAAWREHSRMTLDEVRIHALAYFDAVKRTDAATGRLLDELERRGLLDGTLVVVTSDHGEQLGEHGLFGHTNSLYMPALHVPLLMLWPGRLPAGTRVSGSVSLRDLPATILDLVDADVTLPGRSLVPTWRTSPGGATAREEGGASPLGDPTVPRSPAISYLTQGPEDQPDTPIGRGPAMHSIVRMPYHYIHNGDGSDALYDLVSDPHEVRNLAGTSAGDSALVPLRAELYEIITGEPAPSDLPIRPYRPSERQFPPGRER